MKKYTRIIVAVIAAVMTLVMSATTASAYAGVFGVKESKNTEVELGDGTIRYLVQFVKTVTENEVDNRYCGAYYTPISMSGCKETYYIYRCNAGNSIGILHAPTYVEFNNIHNVPDITFENGTWDWMAFIS